MLICWRPFYFFADVEIRHHRNIIFSEVLMNWKILLALLVSFGLMMSSSYTMLMPFLPIYIRTDLNALNEDVAFWSSITYAVTFAISAFVSPIWGKLSDKMGKKHMMIRSSVLLAITYFLGGIVHSPFELFLVRAFQGIAAGLWPACLVMLSSYVPQNKLGISMGLMQSANICGGILGPLLGGILALSFGMRNSFFIAGAVLSSITIITVFYIKEPPKENNKAPIADTNDKKGLSYIEILRSYKIIPVLMAVMITQLVIQQIQPIIALYVEQMSKESSNAVLLSGFIISIGGAAGAIAAPLWGRLGQKIGFLKTLTIALISAGMFIAAQGIADNLIYFGIMQFVCGLCFSGIFPSLNSILVLLTPSKARGVSFGLMFSAQMAGGAIGPILGGFVATYFNYSSIYFLSGIILSLMAVYIKFFASDELKQKANSTLNQSVSIK